MLAIIKLLLYVRIGSSYLLNDNGHQSLLSRRAITLLGGTLSSTNLLSIEGIAVKGAAIANINGLRGVVATTAIAANSPVVEVNSEVVLQVTNNREMSPFPDFCSQNLWEEMKWDERLAMKLLHLKHVSKENALGKWIEELPQSFSTPLTWSAEELAELQYQSLVEKINSQDIKWKSLYEKWRLESTASKAVVNYSEFQWALQCINSRAFSGPYEGSSAPERRALVTFTALLTLVWPVAGLGTLEQSIGAAFVVVLSILLRDIISLKVSKLKRYVVCPYVDMFNHRSNCISEASTNYFTGQFQLFTGAYNAGDQIYVSYGKQSNDRLLQYYGFIENGNPHDAYEFNCGFIDLLYKYADDLSAVVPFPMVPDPKTRLAGIASALQGTQIQNTEDPNASNVAMSAIDFKCRYFKTPVSSSKQIRSDSVEDILAKSNEKRAAITAHYDDVTVRCMRAFLSSTSEWQTFAKSGGSSSLSSLKGLEIPLSSETEMHVAKALATTAKLELASKSTTLAEDESKFQALLNPEELTSVASSKGFTKDVKRKSISSASKAVVVDPSGNFKDREFSTLAFRIEKKRLLQDAVDLVK